MTMCCTLPYPPTANHLTAVVRGRRVKTKAARDYALLASVCAIRAGVRPLAGPVAVTLRVYRPRKIGDLDNTLKGILDCVKGIAWTDDAQVVRIVAERFEDKVRPRVEMMVEAHP